MRRPPSMASARRNGGYVRGELRAGSSGGGFASPAHAAQPVGPAVAALFAVTEAAPDQLALAVGVAALGVNETASSGTAARRPVALNYRWRRAIAEPCSSELVSE